jgi:hypothetical protein
MSWTDASRLETYQSCPRRYYHKYILRLVPKEIEASPSAAFGLGIHAGLESIYKGDFAEYVPCLHLAERVGDLCIYCEKAEGQIRKMFNEFLKTFPPELEHRVYTQHLGLLLLARYLEKWKEDPLREGTMGVELTFNADLDGTPYVGRLDLLGSWDKVIYVTDHKTKSRITENFVRGFKLDSKMTGYLWAVSELLGEPIRNSLVNTVLVANNITANSFLRFISSRTETDIAQWKDNARRVLDDVERDVARGYFPMNPNSCFSYNRECEYYRICTASANPEGAIAQFYDIKPESDIPRGVETDNDGG